MKCFTCVTGLVVSLLCVSCTVNTTEGNSARMYKEYNEMLYSYEYDHSDTLLFGLYTIDKVRRVYENREELFLKFFIVDSNMETEKAYKPNVFLDSEEISMFETFIDSCLSHKDDDFNWYFNMKSGMTFEYTGFPKNSIYFLYDENNCVNLQVSPKRLKIVLKKFRNDR